MPSSPLTVILNSNHTKKFVFLRPASRAEPLSQVILQEARNKFRSKGLNVVYLRGGIPLGDADDANSQFTSKQVWVGKGEPYCGPPANAAHLNLADVHVIGGKSYIDDSALKQLESVGALHGVRLVVGMPDLHPGNRFPIGCAVASEGVYPALIGSDAGCGIALYHLSSPSKSQPQPKRLAALLQGLDNPWNGSTSMWLERYDIHRTSDFDASSLGTVGAGNHFAEICSLERAVDPAIAEQLGIQEGALYLLGSRGLGSAILASQTANESNPYLLADSPDLQKYLVEHDYAVKWAVANRDLVAHRIKECLFSSREEVVESNQSDPSQLDLGKIIDVTHNSVTKHSITTAGETRDLWVHRKGAAPADKGIVPCPGSRGDFTWLLQPIGDGQYNAHSLAHGAGRRYGRNALHTGSKIPKNSLTTTKLGSEVVCTNHDLLIEERPEAYKDVACVVEDMEEKGVCKGALVFRPVVTYKVREA